MQKRLIVLIPVYRPELEPLEVLSLTSIRKYCHAYPLYFLASEGLRITHPSAQGIPYLYLPKEYFDGFAGYNRLMMSTLLYERIAEYEFCLIAQLDVLLFHDKIEQFLDLPLDYIGALDEYVLPEFPKERVQCFALNGGLSLRRIQAFRTFLKAHAEEVAAWKGTEDNFFSLMGSRYPEEIRLASRKDCLSFSRNHYPRRYDVETHGQVPFGIHGFATFEPCFVRDFLRRLGSPWAESSAWDSECDVQLRQQQAFHAFLSAKKPLFLYGAGAFGKIAATYLKLHHIPVEAFVVSDYQVQKNPRYVAELPIIPISKIADKSAACILFCISLRYKEKDIREILPETLRENNGVEIFLMDYRLYNYMGESIWLSRHKGAVHGDET